MKNSILFTVIFVLWVAVGANATPVTIQIGGTVTSASGTARPGTIYAGVAFTGTYTYESSTIASTINGGEGHHLHNSPYGISLSMGGYEFKTAPSHVGQFDMWIRNDHSVNGVWDYYMVFSDENISVPSLDLTIGSIGWCLEDSTHTALSSGDLPLTAPVLTDWDYNNFEIYGFGNFGLSIEGTVTQAVLIPEPLTGVLMAAGVLLIRRKR